jgi:hypothetical protein
MMDNERLSPSPPQLTNVILPQIPQRSASSASNSTATSIRTLQVKLNPADNQELSEQIMRETFDLSNCKVPATHIIPQQRFTISEYSLNRDFNLSEGNAPDDSSYIYRFSSAPNPLGTIKHSYPNINRVERLLNKRVRQEAQAMFDWESRKQRLEEEW